ncbi:MAG: 16S rRNA G966 N2-methylase RsmD, partial [Myxococcota bacterium]
MDAERRAMAVVFLVGVVSLAYELVQVRMLAFFLGNSMDFLAIPIALLGLAMGSMYRHFAYRGPSDRLVQTLSAALLPTLALVLVAFFVVSNVFFDQIHVSLANPSTDALRLVVYATLFLPPYAIFGALFATLFSEWSHRIGRLYFFDLAGAALGCVLAPMLLTFTDLSTTLVVVLLGALALLWVGGPRTPAVRGAGVVGTVLIAGLAAGGLVFHEQPDPMSLARTVARGAKKVEVVDVEWNEIARTALLRARHGKGQGTSLSIVQDNGLSNVTVLPYRPDRLREKVYEAEWQRRFAWALGLEPKSVLVIFAGAGRDMIAFDALSGGTADVVGVELNPTVVNWAHHPKLEQYRLGEFVDKPNIDLVNAEGRDFLNRDDRTYDLIYVANNGAVHTSRTGHTRKFLDTYEAMGAYLDHLADGGLLIFMNQPVT